MAKASECSGCEDGTDGPQVHVSDARRLRALEGENAKLKKLLAEQSPDEDILKDVAAKKW
jgi:hypothetical protein